MADAIHLRGISDDEDRTLNHLLEQLEKRKAGNLLRASYYDGKHAVGSVGSIIPPQYYRLGIVLGWVATGIDALGERCNLDQFVWPDGSLDDIGAREVWDGNQLATEVDSAVISTLIHGVSFLVNTRGGEGETAGLIHVKDALNATGEWNARKRGLDSLLSITGRDDKSEPTALTLYLDGVTINAEKRNGRWQRADRQEHPWGVPAEAMIYKPRTWRPFGYSRITGPAMTHQDAALRSLIRLEGHMDVYSYPELWMFGPDMSVFQNADGSMKPDWRIVLGRIKGIPDDDDAANPRADVKQFAAASPEPHLAALNAQAKLMAREMQLPDTSLAITDVANPTSAEAYTASNEPLISKAEQAQENFTRPLRQAFLRALAMQNDLDAAPDEWLTVAPKWRGAKFLSRSAEADAGQKQLAAVPWLAETEVGLELLGLDPQQIRRAMAERRRARGAGVLESLRVRAEAVTAGADGDGVTAGDG